MKKKHTLVGGSEAMWAVSQATERHGLHMFAQPAFRKKHDSQLECFDTKRSCKSQNMVVHRIDLGCLSSRMALLRHSKAHY